VKNGEGANESALLEKLIPWVNKPIAVHAITALKPALNAAGKEKLKLELQQLWRETTHSIAHRPYCKNTVEVEFKQLTHFICRSR
jgi:hypothetical protein